MENQLIDIGHLITALRLELGLPVNWVAHKLKMERQAYLALEAGELELTALQALALERLDSCQHRLTAQSWLELQRRYRNDRVLKIQQTKNPNPTT